MLVSSCATILCELPKPLYQAVRSSVVEKLVGLLLSVSRSWTQLALDTPNHERNVGTMIYLLQVKDLKSMAR